MAEANQDDPATPPPEAEPTMEELRQQLADMAGLRQRNRDLQEHLADLAARHDQELAQLRQQMRQQQAQPQTVNVQVTAPTPTPRLKVFTVLAPTGGNEVNFTDWEAQAEQIAIDPNVREEVQTLRTTLRGLALEQVKQCLTAAEVIGRLRHSFGDVKAPEDLYLDFCEIKMDKKELPSQFLLRLWNSLLHINKTTHYDEHELSVKLYRALVRAISASHELLSLEIRSQFGFPGTAGPRLEDLLRTVRRLEESVPLNRRASAHSSAQQTGEEDARFERLVNRVAERLEGTLSASAGPARRVFRGRCYNCGEEGNHYARNCPHPPSLERDSGYQTRPRQPSSREQRQPPSQPQRGRHQSPQRQRRPESQQQWQRQRPQAHQPLNGRQPLERSVPWQPQ